MGSNQSQRIGAETGSSEVKKSNNKATQTELFEKGRQEPNNKPVARVMANQRIDRVGDSEWDGMVFRDVNNITSLWN